MARTAAKPLKKPKQNDRRQKAGKQNGRSRKAGKSTSISSTTSNMKMKVVDKSSSLNQMSIAKYTKKKTNDSESSTLNSTRGSTSKGRNSSLDSRNQSIFKGQKRTHSAETRGRLVGTRSCNFTETQVNKWVKLSKDTLDFADSILVSSLSSTRSGSPSDSSDTEEEVTVSRLKDQIFNKLQRIKVPRNMFGDYKKLDENRENLIELRDRLEGQEDNLERTIIMVKDNIQSIEDRKESQLDQRDNSKLHPLIQNYQPALNLPQYRDTLFNHH